jgi:hypothetical protein
MFWRIFFTVVLVVVVVAILLVDISHRPSVSPRVTEARITMASLRTSIKAYSNEYGHLPPLSPDGLYETAATNAKLIRMLTAQDSDANPGKIAYFEARTARNHRAGIDLDGTLMDPWGNFYRVRIDADGDRKIANPYSDGPAIEDSVIVWSLGKDGVQGSAKSPNKLQGSDDIVSWQ